MIVTGKPYKIAWAVLAQTPGVPVLLNVGLVSFPSTNGTFSSEDQEFLKKGTLFDQAKKDADQALMDLDITRPETFSDPPPEAVKWLTWLTDDNSERYLKRCVGPSGKVTYRKTKVR